MSDTTGQIKRIDRYYDTASAYMIALNACYEGCMQRPTRHIIEETAHQIASCDRAIEYYQQQIADKLRARVSPERDRIELYRAYARRRMMVYLNRHPERIPDHLLL